MSSTKGVEAWDEMGDGQRRIAAQRKKSSADNSSTECPHANNPVHGALKKEFSRYAADTAEPTNRAMCMKIQ